MLNLTNSGTDKLQLVTDSTATVDVFASWADLNGTTVTPGNTGTAISSATTTDIVATPGASTVRNVKTLTIRNRHASTSVTVTVVVDKNGTDYELHKTVLLAGECLEFDEGLGFYTLSAGKQAATQSDQETGTDLTKFVSPGTQHYHPSACKCWGEFNGNSTTVLASFNITSVADTATGAMTVTIGTDFSSVNWCCQVSRAEDDLTLVYSATYDAKAAGSVILRSAVEAGSGSDPSAASGNASWSFVGWGDQ